MASNIYRKEKTMSDLIRRHDAVRLLTEHFTGLKDDLSIPLSFFPTPIEYFRELINQIPTAEQLVTVKAKQNEGLYLDTDEETLLETEYIVVATDGMYKEYIHETDGKPRVGKWFDHSDEGYVQCPFCGSLTTCEDNIDELHYCFNCGAKMERSE